MEFIMDADANVSPEFYYPTYPDILIHLEWTLLTNHIIRIKIQLVHWFKKIPSEFPEWSNGSLIPSSAVSASIPPLASKFNAFDSKM